MELKRVTMAVSVLLLLSACSATGLRQGASMVEAVSDAPDRSRCRFLGEVIGSQGNWLTGDFTANAKLIEGARNELRNKTYALGGNVVHIQSLTNTNNSVSLGNTSATVAGNAYSCAR